MTLEDSPILDLAPDRRASLHDLLQAAGPARLVPLVLPRGSGVGIRSTIMLGAADRIHAAEDSVLLLLGASPADSRLVSIVEEAAEAGGVAVVVKGDDPPSAAVQAVAAQTGVALLRVAEDVSWRSLDAELVSALGAFGVAPERSGGDELFAIADSIASVFGGSAAVEDLEQNVVAYSSLPGQRIDSIREAGILGRRVPLAAAPDRDYRSIMTSPGVVRFPETGPELARSAVAVRAGSLPLGSIWVIECDQHPGPRGERALLEGAERAAVHLLAVREVGERRRHRASAALQVVLRGGAPSAAELSGLAVAQRTPVMLVVFGQDKATGSGAAAQLAASLSRHCTAYRADAVVARDQDRVYLLVPEGDSAAVTRLARVAVSAVDYDGVRGVRAAVCLSPASARHVVDLRAEVDEVLDSARDRAIADRVVTMASVRGEVLAARIGAELQRTPELGHPGVVEMAQHDALKDTQLTTTMLTWLENLGSVSEAARQLNVHENTVRYRLLRCEQLFGVTVTSSDDRLLVWLQLRGLAAQGRTAPTS